MNRPVPYIKELTDVDLYMTKSKILYANAQPDDAIKHLMVSVIKLINFSSIFYSEYRDKPSVEYSDSELMEIHVTLSNKMVQATSILANMYVRNVESDGKASVLKDVLSSMSPVARFVDIQALSNRIDQLLNNQLSTSDAISKILPSGLAKLDISKASGYSSIRGQDAALTEIKDRVALAKGTNSNRSFILYGPPGTGKTSIALAIAVENQIPIYSISQTELGGKFVGEFENNVANLFKYLNTLDGSFILFIDEVDNLVSREVGSRIEDKIANKVITTNLYNFIMKKRDGGSRIIIMTTNFLNRIDESIVRISLPIEITIPSIADIPAVASQYKNLYGLNLTVDQFNELNRMFAEKKFAPSYIAQVFEKMSSNLLIDVIRKNGHLSKDLPKFQGTIFDMGSVPVAAVNVEFIYQVTFENSRGGNTLLGDINLGSRVAFPLYGDSLTALVDSVK